MVLLPFIFIFPLLSYLILRNPHLPPNKAKIITNTSLTSSLVIVCYSCYNYFNVYHTGSILNVTLGGWLKIDTYIPTLNFVVDGLSLMMVVIISLLGLSIHIFNSQHSQDVTYYRKYCLYLNASIALLLILVLTDNLLVLYLSLESLLMVFYLFATLDKRATAKASGLVKVSTPISSISNEEISTNIQEKILNVPTLKTLFVNNRLTSLLLLVSFFFLYKEFETFTIPTINTIITEFYFYSKSGLIMANAILILSFFTLLTRFPYSIKNFNQSISSVTACVYVLISTCFMYLCARLYPLFAINSELVFWWFGVVGGLSYIMAGLGALVQTDVRKVISYTGVSQIGLVLISIGIGAWESAMIHLVSYVCFQSLLFMASDYLLSHIDKNTDTEQPPTDIKNMGGLATRFPLLCVSFVVTGGVLMAFPFVTSSFYAIQGMLYQVHVSGYLLLNTVILFGLFITALYSTRLIYLIFFKKQTCTLKEVGIHKKVSINEEMSITDEMSTTINKDKKSPIFYNKWLFSILILLLPSILIFLSPSISYIFIDLLPTHPITYNTIPYLNFNEPFNGTDPVYMAMYVTLMGILLSYVYHQNKHGIVGKAVSKLVESNLGKNSHTLFYHSFGMDALFKTVVKNTTHKLAQWRIKTLNGNRKSGSLKIFVRIWSMINKKINEGSFKIYIICSFMASCFTLVLLFILNQTMF